MASKANGKKQSISQLPESLRLAGDEILRGRGENPDVWREEQIQRAKLAVLSGADTAWTDGVLLQAYAALFAEEYLQEARRKQEYHGGEAGE